MKLNVACGSTRWPGFHNTDINREPGTEWLDLEDRPYPYQDNTAELVMISHGLHLTNNGTPVHPNFQAIIREFHRILQPGGWLRIDDNPYRTYDDTTEHVDEGAGYPADLRISRGDFTEMLRNVGFDPVLELDSGDTQIDTDEETRQAITGNGRLHVSFAVEAQK